MTIDNIKAVMEHIRLNQQRVGTYIVYRRMMYVHTRICIHISLDVY